MSSLAWTRQTIGGGVPVEAKAGEAESTKRVNVIACSCWDYVSLPSFIAMIYEDLIPWGPRQ